jgi:hypothetical protein
MRDLLRAEIEHAQRPSPIARVFDNTYVLVASLALLVVGGLWWFQRGQLEPEERLELVKQLLVDGEGWREAEEHIQVLLAEDPDSFTRLSKAGGARCEKPRTVRRNCSCIGQSIFVTWVTSSGPRRL